MQKYDMYIMCILVIIGNIKLDTCVLVEDIRSSAIYCVTNSNWCRRFTVVVLTVAWWQSGQMIVSFDWQAVDCGVTALFLRLERENAAVTQFLDEVVLLPELVHHLHVSLERIGQSPATI